MGLRRFIWSDDPNKPRVMVMTFTMAAKLHSLRLVERTTARTMFRNLLDEGMLPTAIIGDYVPSKIAMTNDVLKAVAIVEAQTTP